MLFGPIPSDLGRHQLISEQTHMMDNCIGLVFTNQPSLMLESGVYPSLHEHFHHQIIYGELCVANIALPFYTRRIWFYDEADCVAIMKSIGTLRWHELLDTIPCPGD